MVFASDTTQKYRELRWTQWRGENSRGPLHGTHRGKRQRGTSAQWYPR